MIKTGLLQKLQPIVPRTSLLTIYKSFIRPHLDYGDVVYDQPSNDVFSNKFETVQYMHCFGNYGSNKRHISKKIVSEYIQRRRWMRRLCLCYKAVSAKSTKIPA